MRDINKYIAAIRSLQQTNPIVAKVIKTYQKPGLDLLKDYNQVAQVDQQANVKAIESKLYEFCIEGEVVNVRTGPVISRYEIKLAAGVKLSQVRAIADDLALALMGKIRIQAPIPGTALVGIEIENEKPAIIGLKDILSTYDGKEKLPIATCVDTIGKAKIFDLTKMPHLLIAGQTGSGKSVCLNDIILSLLYTKTPEECKLVLVDPKRVEMVSYKNIPHLWCPIVTEPERACDVFASLLKEMERRYELFAVEQVRNIESYNVGGTKMPYIVAVVDEMADLMMTSGKQLETMIVRLAQLARAVGIHLVLATQKPIVKVITGLIKSNMPSRIAFQVSSRIDSAVILDCKGAEKLIGRGDMLMAYPGAAEPERFHGAWVSDAEIAAVTNFIKE